MPFFRNKNGVGVLIGAGGLTRHPLRRYPHMAADIALMSQPNGIIPGGVAEGISWRTAPVIHQGMSPTNTNIPWWPGPVFAEWRAIAPWWFASRGHVDHTATNTCIEISGHVLNVLRSSGEWDVLYSNRGTDWLTATAETAVGIGQGVPWQAVGLDGGVEFQPGTLFMGSLQSMHGGGHKRVLWDTPAPNYIALHSVVRCRLALRDRAGVDDRANARFGMQVGADYYPTLTATASEMLHQTTGEPVGYMPGVGTGNFTRVLNDWTFASFTVRNPGVDLVANPPPAFPFV